ncbi:MAG: hypothetical protein IKY89_05610 [Alistipes sp.]|nr:hypothetical protein [Alistipes sp.]
MTFGVYNTAAELWTLTAWGLSEAKHQENLVDVPGRQAGPLDLSTALTDGEPVFGARSLSATFESSEGTRLERKYRIDNMINRLAGRQLQITLPDDPDRYLIGRLTVTELYNDLAHCSVKVEATCEPWKYAKALTVIELEATTTEKAVKLPNAGRLTVCPTIEIIGEGAGVTLLFGELRTSVLGPGTWTLPDLQVPQDGLELSYRGSGSIKLTYREAVL